MRRGFLAATFACVLIPLHVTLLGYWWLGPSGGAIVMDEADLQPDDPGWWHGPAILTIVALLMDVLWVRLVSQESGDLDGYFDDSLD